MADPPALSYQPAGCPWMVGSRARGLALVLLFTTTLFLSSTLLFVVQPMVGKMVLPVFGGTPAVWNTCMVFFQAVLLAGYAYAHATTAWLGARRQALVHVALLLVPLGLLPITVEAGREAPTGADPVPWLLWRLLTTVGFPFFVVSTSAPLLQRWFSVTGHAGAKDPYFLYAASNAGSLLALLGYPLLIEPALGLTDQSRIWAAGYAVLVGLAVICVLVLRRSPAAVEEASSEDAEGDVRAGSPAGTEVACPSLRVRLWWVLLAMVPSSLMLGVTTHITTDLATVPLLWVLPLALYLITFVLVFSRRNPIPSALPVRALPYVMLPTAALTFLELKRMGWIVVPLHLTAFFTAAMVCHGRLAHSRPPARHLTGFYLCMSIGGLAGGLFNAIIAPVVFDQVAEYPLMTVAACLLVPAASPARRDARARRLDVVLPIALAVLAVIVVSALRVWGMTEGALSGLLAFGVPALACFGFKDRPVRFGLGFAAILATSAWCQSLRNGRLLHIERNFFGVKRVAIEPEGRFRQMIHGSILHGSQSLDPQRRGVPLTYYHPTGPAGDVFSTINGSGLVSRVAVIGLGTGSLAAYARPGQHFTFYEIDPVVARLAGDTRYFTFLEECTGSFDIVLGDGRLTLAEAPDRSYGAIVLDAFSSDSIPTHLVTQEALRIYMSKLADGGVLAFHISNRYLDLKPVLGNLAAEAGLICLFRTDGAVSAAEQAEGKSPSEYAVMARRRADLGALADDPDWHLTPTEPSAGVWTDQFSNILSLVRWK